MGPEENTPMTVRDALNLCVTLLIEVLTAFDDDVESAEEESA